MLLATSGVAITTDRIGGSVVTNRQSIAKFSHIFSQLIAKRPSTTNANRLPMKHTSAPLFAILALTSAAALAQATPPDAGRILQEVTPLPKRPPPRAPETTIEERPAALPDDGQRILVKGFRISGATVFADSELLPLVGDVAGKNLGFAELDAVAARLTRHYRDAGYLLARAYLAPQDIRDGIVTIAVAEGRVGQVNVTNKAGLAASALAPVSNVVPGEVIRADALEASLLALSDIPGVEVKSTLRPGAAVGTSDFLVDVEPGVAFSGSADFDTFGNRYTGTYRLGTSLSWNNPVGLGDQANLRAQTSGDGFLYGRLGYQLPVGASATRIGAAWSHMHYKLGESCAYMRADGDATVGSLYLLQPLLRSRQANWSGQLEYDNKQLVDRIGSTSTEIDKTLRNWTLGLNGNLLDGVGGGGSTTLSLSYTNGELNLDAVQSAIDRVTARSKGSFDKWSASLQRVQRLPADMTITVSASGQWAGKNLDSSEKFALGGAYGVRAYPQGEASGDEGHLVSVELRKPIFDRWEGLGFYDDGHATINRNPWTAETNRLHLAGYGIGAAYSGGGYTFRVFAAWKAGTARPASDVDRNPRVWAQAAVYF